MPFMLRRLRLDPAAEGGGGTTATPTPTPSPTLPAGAIVVSADEWNELRGYKTQLAQIQADKARELEAKEQERLKILAEKEGAEKALEAQRTGLESKLTAAEQRAQQIERRMLDANKSAVIAQALAGVTFAGDTAEDQAEAAAQLRLLLERDVEASLDANGNVLVRDRTTGRPADQVLREALAGKKFAHFLARKGGDGTGGGGGDRTGKTEETEGVKPGSLEAIAAEYKANQAKYQSMGLYPVWR